MPELSEEIVAMVRLLLIMPIVVMVPTQHQEKNVSNVTVVVVVSVQVLSKVFSLAG